MASNAKDKDGNSLKKEPATKKTTKKADKKD